MNVSLGNKWRRLEERDRLKRVSVSSMAELEQKLMEGVASLERGEGVEGEAAFKHLKRALLSKLSRPRGKARSSMLPGHILEAGEILIEGKDRGFGGGGAGRKVGIGKMDGHGAVALQGVQDDVRLKRGDAAAAQ